MLSLTFCVKRAILSYNGYIRLPVDTTISEEKAEGVGWGKVSPRSHPLKLKSSIFVNSLQYMNKYYIIPCNIHIYSNTS